MRTKGLRRALAGVGAAALLTFPIAASAQAPRANDGRSLADEPAATQAVFQAAWGDQAATQWVEEHNAELARIGPATDRDTRDTGGIPGTGARGAGGTGGDTTDTGGSPGTGARGADDKAPGVQDRPSAPGTGQTGTGAGAAAPGSNVGAVPPPGQMPPGAMPPGAIPPGAVPPGATGPGMSAAPISPGTGLPAGQGTGMATNLTAPPTSGGGVGQPAPATSGGGVGQPPAAPATTNQSVASGAPVAAPTPSFGVVRGGSR